jgi:hypothetical protein
MHSAPSAPIPTPLSAHYFCRIATRGRSRHRNDENPPQRWAQKPAGTVPLPIPPLPQQQLQHTVRATPPNHIHPSRMKQLKTCWSRHIFNCRAANWHSLAPPIKPQHRPTIIEYHFTSGPNFLSLIFYSFSSSSSFRSTTSQARQRAGRETTRPRRQGSQRRRRQNQQQERQREAPADSITDESSAGRNEEHRLG